MIKTTQQQAQIRAADRREDSMDLNFSKEELAFRDEVRQFFKDSVPASVRRKLEEGRSPTKQELVEWWRIPSSPRAH